MKKLILLATLLTFLTSCSAPFLIPNLLVNTGWVVAKEVKKDSEKKASK